MQLIQYDAIQRSMKPTRILAVVSICNVYDHNESNFL